MQHLRNALRALRSHPLLIIAAVLSLGLGIGANTAIFTLVDRLMLRTLPIRQAERLALVGARDRTDLWSNPVYEQIRDRTDLFNGAAAWGSERFNLAAAGEADFADGLWVSGSYFEVLGVPAAHGRVLTRDDDSRGGGSDGSVAVISDGYWRRRFGSAPDVIGRPLKIRGVTYTIVGITPAAFFGTETGQSFDIAVPLGTLPLTRSSSDALDGVTGWLSILVRLKERQTVGTATMALRASQVAIRDASLPAGVSAEERGEHLQRLGEPFTVFDASRGSSYLRDLYEKSLLSLTAIAAVVLLVACGNVAMLLLGRGVGRRHELSLRRALGASRLSLVRSLLTESLLLALAGSAIGTVIGLAGSRLIARELGTESSPITLDLSLDWHVLLFSALVAVGAALLFGTVPALRATRVEPGEVLKEQSRGSSGRARLGGGLVIAQVAFSLTLVTTAGLFVQTLHGLSTINLGFDRENVMLVSIDARQADVDAEHRAALYERTRQAILATPGVAAAAVSRITPVSGNTWNRTMGEKAGRGLSEQERQVSLNLVTPGWFDAYHMPLVAGRDFGEHDDGSASRVAVVSESFARRFLGRTNAVGETIEIPPPPGGTPKSAEVIGVVPDAVYRALRDSRPPTIFLAFAQQGPVEPSTTLSVRTTSAMSAGLKRAITDAITGVDASIVVSFEPLSTVIADSLIQERVVAILSSFSAVVTLLLSGLGLYGVTSYHARRRQAEMGIRVALGASTLGVLRLVMRRVAWQLGAGLAIGVLAAWLPARRAAGVDPAIVMREQ